MPDITGNAAEHAAMGWGGDHDPDEAILNARPIPKRSTQRNCLVPVTARLEWESGEEHVETVATAYAGRDVLVQLDLPRRVKGVWLDVGDAPRR